MFEQVVSEMAGLLADETVDPVSEFIVPLRNLAVTSGLTGCRFGAARAWLYIKEAFFTNQLLFLRQCCDFLRAERSSHPALWLATALDLATVCKVIDYERFISVSLDLSLEPLPPNLRKAFASLTKNLGP
jgi:hypothetical protein